MLVRHFLRITEEGREGPQRPDRDSKKGPSEYKSRTPSPVSTVKFVLTQAGRFLLSNPTIYSSPVQRGALEMLFWRPP
jgi:hypothetical protein